MSESLQGNDVFPFESCLLVIPRRVPRLFLLNPTARTVWEGLAAGAAPAQLAAGIAGRFDVPAARVRADVEAILAEWRAHGLLAPAPRSAIVLEAGEAAPGPIRMPRRFHSQRVYALCGRPIRLRFEAAEIARAIEPPLAHSAVPSARTTDNIDVLRDGAGYLVVGNGSDVERAATLEDALGEVLGRILELSYPDAGWLAVMHAAAVGDATGAVVMAGASGSGKSTLSAALVDAGFRYFSDDVVPLDQALRVRPMPLGISVKEGAWPVLAARYPELDALPVHQGRRRRYLPIDRARTAPGAGLPVKSLVFPRYQPNQPTVIKPLAPLQVLERLTRSRSWMSLDGRRFASTLAWIKRTWACDLSHASLAEGVLAVQRWIVGESTASPP